MARQESIPALEEPTSKESAVFEVLLDDDVCDRVEHKFDVLRVRSTSHMGIDLLHVTSHVELEELHLDVVARVLVCVGPWQGKGVLLLGVPTPSRGGEAQAQITGLGRRLAARLRGGGGSHRRNPGSRC